jgi:hypothetical protein
MISGGTSPIKAKSMYFAVYRFGPKWVVDKTVPCPVGFLCDAQNSSPLQVTLEARPVANTSEMQDAAKKIELEDPSVSDIEEMADKQLFSHASRLDVVGKEIDHDGNQKTINQSSVRRCTRCCRRSNQGYTELTDYWMLRPRT